MTLQFPLDRISIRPAELSDIDWGSALIFSSGPALFSYVFATKTDEAQEILRQAFESPGHAFSYEYAQILEVDHQPVGLIMGYPGDVKRKAEEKVQSVMAKIMPLKRVPRILVNLADLTRIKQSVELDQYFVMSLCILPEYRDRGLGTALLQDTELYAQELGCTSISLDLAYTNIRAQELLTRLGYQITCSKTSDRFKSMTDAGGLHRLEKRLV